MEILKLPHPNLFKVCKDITVFGPELKVLLDGMYEAMIASNGIGLASNQVGLDWRMFVMTDKSGQRVNLVNPVIVAKSSAPANLKEGCLSAPGEFVILSERASWTVVSYKDEKGDEHQTLFQGIHSVCVQHEIDHLFGKSHLQSKSIPKAKRKLLATKWGLE